MKNEYAIINLSDYRQRLERLRKFVGTRKPTESEYAKIQIYSALISESTPLIPVIENAFDEGKAVGIVSYLPSHSLNKELYNERKEHYINNLKLDI